MPRAGTATQASEKTISREAECVGASFDLEKLFSKAGMSLETKPDRRTVVRYGPCSWDVEQAVPLARLGGPEAIAIDVKADPPAVAPGGTAKLTVTFRNGTSEPRTVAFERCSDALSLTLEARQGSERADLVASDFGCGVSWGCEPLRVAVTLAPGGTVTTRGEYRAQRKKLSSSCTERPIGSLAAGEYTLHVRTPLHFMESPSSVTASFRVAETNLRVRK
jgi:hypothetical protein